MAPEHQGRERPESIVARNFSQDLDSLFGLHSGTTIGNLSETVQEKKRNVSTQEQELADLESRLREAEERLAQARGPSSPQQDDTTVPGASRQPSYGAEGAMDDASRRVVPMHRPVPNNHPAANYAPAGARPSNNRAESFMPHIPGAMPITPTPRFEGRDYVTMDRSR